MTDFDVPNDERYFEDYKPGATYEFAEIVYSVTSLPSVRGVLFEYNGSKIGRWVDDEVTILQ